MVVTTVVTVLCTTGIAFYIRFFVALCKESTRSWVGYLVRLEPAPDELEISGPPQQHERVA